MVAQKPLDLIDLSKNYDALNKVKWISPVQPASRFGMTKTWLAAYSFNSFSALNSLLHIHTSQLYVIPFKVGEREILRKLLL
jgi:hypothetical protein